MKNRDDIYLIGFDMIDDPIRPLYHFTDLVQVILRNFPARKGMFSDLLGAASQSIHHLLGIFRRVLCDVLINAIKMILCGICPMDIHSGSPYFLRTSRTSLVQPALLSANPRSITSRTYIS